jgi:flagellar biosynthesis protein FlhG
LIDQASRLRSLVAGDDVPRADVGVPILRQAQDDRSVSHARETSHAREISQTQEISNTRVIAVTSGKGGVGKTTIAVNLALMLAEMGKRTLLVDADLGLANVDVMLGIDSVRHVGHLLLESSDPEEVAATGPFGVRFISGGSGLREFSQSNHTIRRQILEKLRAYYREYEYVIVDTSPGIGAEVTDFLRGADETLLVTTSEPTSLKDTYAAMKSIVRELPENELRLIVTSATSGQARDAAATLNDVARKFLARTVKQWQHVETDALVSRSVKARVPLVCGYPRSSAAMCLRHLAKELSIRTPGFASERVKRQVS